MTAKPLNQLSGMPQMGAAFAGWQKQITLTKRSQTITNGLVSYVDSTFNFMGTIQPLSPKQIELKPEGQRAWEWLQIHVQNSTQNLTTDDQIFYNGKYYKIMANNDYSQSGFWEYHAVGDYQP